MTVEISEHIPEPAATKISLARAAEILQVSLPVLRKGLQLGVIHDLSMATIGDLASRPVLDSVEINGAPVPVLRPGPAIRYTGDKRPFSGFDITASDEHQLLGLDRWWKDPGREMIVAAGGFLVAVGSVIVAALRLLDDKPESVIERQDGYIHYVSELAGRVSETGERRILLDPVVHPEWFELVDRTLGKRVLGGGGGHFTRVS